jgi:hypothetical protein
LIGTEFEVQEGKTTIKVSHKIVPVKDTESALKKLVKKKIGMPALFNRIERFSEIKLSKSCKKEMKENPRSFVSVCTFLFRALTL